MKKLFLLSILALCAAFSGCLPQEEQDRVKEVEVMVYPETTFITRDNDITCDALMFAESDEPGTIHTLSGYLTEGFDFEYERGYTYTFKARKIWMANPPMDVSSIRYVRTGEIVRQKADVEIGEREVVLTVAPQTVRYMPLYPGVPDANGRPTVFDALAVRERMGTRLALDPPPDSDVPIFERELVLTAIEGFSHEPGYEYVLRAQRIATAEPYTVRYVLIEQVSKQPK